MTSLIYRWPFLYRMAIRMSYLGNYHQRYSLVSELISDGVRVVDYCCGDAEIYSACLKQRNIDYLGLDFNDRFISTLRSNGVPCRKFNILESQPLDADYGLLMGSLYQFIPDHATIVDKILAHTNHLIISEPVKSRTESRNLLVRKLAYWLNDPGDGTKRYRFTSESFRDFVNNYQQRLENYIEGPIDVIAVLRGDVE